MTSITLARAILKMYANSAPVMVRMGIISTCGLPIIDSPGIMMLEEGSHPSVDDRINSRAIPVTNSGSEIVTRPPRVSTRSQIVSDFDSHDHTHYQPQGDGDEERANREKSGIEQASAYYAGDLLADAAMPKSPRTAPPTQSKYRTWGGLSSPIRSRRAFRLSGVAPWPSIAEAASPGANSISEKIATETASNVTRMRDSLTMRNLAM